MKKQVG